MCFIKQAPFSLGLNGKGKRVWLVWLVRLVHCADSMHERRAAQRP